MNPQEIKLEHLTAGMLIPYSGNQCTVVPESLARAFKPGDRLHVVQKTGALLHVPASVHDAVSTAITLPLEASLAMRAAQPTALARFYRRLAELLADDRVWHNIDYANQADLRRAVRRQRSTTRLAVSDTQRREMIEGVWSWHDRSADVAPNAQVQHADWTIDIVQAPLGVIGFVFEARPNVLVDAVGILSTRNTAVLRVGRDAIGTTRAIHRHAILPALVDAGLPEDAVSLLDIEDHAAGWALFADSRLGLAVARGSGQAVDELAAVARQNGVAVSAHGTGGAWMIADASADSNRFASAVAHSLDRKVCNTLNVCCIVRERAPQLVPLFLRAVETAAARHGKGARLHILEGSEPHVPPDVFKRRVAVHRGGAPHQEPYASTLNHSMLGEEWHWDETPELTLAIVEDLDHAINLFNSFSPRFICTLIAEDPAARTHFDHAVEAPFVGDGFTRWVDGQYALGLPELGLSNWQGGRLLKRGGLLQGGELTTIQLLARHRNPDQHR